MTDQIGAVVDPLINKVQTFLPLESATAGNNADEAPPVPPAYFPIVQDIRSYAGLLSLPPATVKLIFKAGPKQAPIEIKKASLLLSSDITEIKKMQKSIIEAIRQYYQGRYYKAFTRVAGLVEVLRVKGPGMDQIPQLLLEMAYPKAYWKQVKAASEENDVDPYLVLAMIRTESKFDPLAKSRRGASGLMQLMPSTAKEQAEKIKITAKMHDPGTNVLIGVAYLKNQIRKFKDLNWSLAAYNGGRGNALRWMSKMAKFPGADIMAIVDFSETQKYIKSVLENLEMYRQIYKS